jgi:hypothetical protein
MKRQQKPPAPRPYGRIDRPPERCKRPTFRSLLAAGFPFEPMGYWTKNVTAELSEADTPGVYIWVLDRVAVYVGEGRSIGLRHQYHGRYPRALCHHELRAALARGKRVAIYGIKDPIAKWNGIKLPARRAIEHALLLDWVFDWNRGGQGKIAVAGS